MLQVEPEHSLMTFVTGQKRNLRVFLRNQWFEKHFAFKIQCTCAKNFRVRPSLGVLRASQTQIIEIQLATTTGCEQQSSDQAQENKQQVVSCKFLVVFLPVDLSNLQQPHETLKFRFSKEQPEATTEILARIVPPASTCELSANHNSVMTNGTIPVPSRHNHRIEDQKQQQQPQNFSTLPLTLADLMKPESLKIITLLMRDKSRHPSNRLSEDQLAFLAAKKQQSDQMQWDCWNFCATEMRRALCQKKKLCKASKLKP